MAADFKDVVVSIRADKMDELLSMLLGHGFQPDQSSMSADGQVAFYAVGELSAKGREDLARIGAEVVKEWRPGEVIDKP